MKSILLLIMTIFLLACHEKEGTKLTIFHTKSQSLTSSSMSTTKKKTTASLAKPLNLYSSKQTKIMITRNQVKALREAQMKLLLSRHQSLKTSVTQHNNQIQNSWRAYQTQKQRP